MHNGNAVAVVVTGQSLRTAGTVLVVMEAQAGTAHPEAVGQGWTVKSVKHGHDSGMDVALEVEAVSPEAPVDVAEEGGLVTCVAAAAHKATMVLKAFSEKNIFYSSCRQDLQVCQTVKGIPEKIRRPV